MSVIYRQGGPDVSSWPVFIGQAVNTAISNAFTRIPLLAVRDTHSSFDAVSGAYLIPQDGIYRIEMKIRYDDSTPGGLSIGLGAGKAAVDDAAFLWGVTATVPSGTPRNGLINQRILQCTQGDQILLYSYCDGGGTYYTQAGEMTIDRIR